MGWRMSGIFCCEFVDGSLVVSLAEDILGFLE